MKNYMYYDLYDLYSGTIVDILKTSSKYPLDAVRGTKARKLMDEIFGGEWLAVNTFYATVREEVNAAHKGETALCICGSLRQPVRGHLIDMLLLIAINKRYEKEGV